MILGLKEIQIRGEIRCNVDYTIDLLNVCYLILSYRFNLHRVLTDELTTDQFGVFRYR
jgi:hypothetical protein